VLAAVLGGLLCGAGMLILFRHGASLGGLNVLVLRLQDRFGWPAGKSADGVDALIVLRRRLSWATAPAGAVDAGGRGAQPGAGLQPPAGRYQPA
jgi:hypothetical protein